VEDSASRDNGENGIMMDEDSTHDEIIGNIVVDNTGDGLVASSSPDDDFADNPVTGNRIGVRLSVGDARGTTLTRNQIDGNVLAVQHVSLGRTNSSAATVINGTRP
jgi:nitrous oxidase accessory protein NosD